MLLETNMKHIWNAFELHLKHIWKMFEMHLETHLSHIWNAFWIRFEPHLKCISIAFETHFKCILKHIWYTPFPPSSTSKSDDMYPWKWGYMLRNKVWTQEWGYDTFKTTVTFNVQWNEVMLFVRMKNFNSFDYEICTRYPPSQMICTPENVLMCSGMRLWHLLQGFCDRLTGMR